MFRSSDDYKNIIGGPLTSYEIAYGEKLRGKVKSFFKEENKNYDNWYS